MYRKCQASKGKGLGHKLNLARLLQCRVSVSMKYEVWITPVCGWLPWNGMEIELAVGGLLACQQLQAC